MIEQDNKDRFISMFANISGYYDLNSYTNGFGFNLKRKLKSDSNYISLLSFYIYDDKLNSENNRKNIRVKATYGLDDSQGILLRSIEECRISDPIDLIDTATYFYEFDTNKIFKNNKEITPPSVAFRHI